MTLGAGLHDAPRAVAGATQRRPRLGSEIEIRGLVLADGVEAAVAACEQIATMQSDRVGDARVQLLIDADLQLLGQRRFAERSRTVDQERPPQ